MPTELHEERKDTPHWDTKVRCTCGAEFCSRCEFWLHAANALREALVTYADHG